MEKVYAAIEAGLRATVHDRKWLPDDGTGLHLLSSEEILKPFIAKCRGDIDAAISAVQSEREVFRDRVTRDMETLLGKRIIVSQKHSVNV